MKTKMKKCIVCGASFKPYVTKQQYCSARCRIRARTLAPKSKASKEGSLNNYISYCKIYGNIPYAEYQTKVLRKCGVQLMDECLNWIKCRRTDCMYHAPPSSNNGCDYCWIKDELRGCPLGDKCTKYVFATKEKQDKARRKVAYNKDWW